MYLKKLKDYTIKSLSLSLMCIMLLNSVKRGLRVWLSGIDPVARNYSFLCRVPELC